MKSQNVFAVICMKSQNVGQNYGKAVSSPPFERRTGVLLPILNEFLSLKTED